MFYYIKITANDGKEIVMNGLENQGITSYMNGVKLWIDTINENVSERSADILNKVEIRLAIVGKTKKICRDLMEWSLQPSGNAIYRTVHIDIFDSQNNIIRSFDLKKMFVEDYIETFDKGDGNDGGEAVLKLIQAANNSDKFRQDSSILSSTL